MVVKIFSSSKHLGLRSYIYDWIFRDRLGLQLSHFHEERDDIAIGIEGHAGEVRLPDIFLSLPQEDWLQPSSMPTLPLNVWNAAVLDKNIPLIDLTVPIIFGSSLPQGNRDAASVTLPIDIFGSAVFMLGRYEEMISSERDAHDRFPAKASMAHQAGFIERPIIDEYIEILWAALKKICPHLQRKENHFSISLSHDVDFPSQYAFSSFGRLAKQLAREAVLKRHFFGLFQAPITRLNTKRKLHNSDPANTFDWIMDVSDQQGLRSSFYFICGCTDRRFDADYRIDHPAIRHLIRRIHARGHEIGLHPSYHTYLDQAKFLKESKLLRKICREEGVNQTTWGGRMHYLRWRQPDTMLNWEQAGMDYDSTLGYADHVGFRCGTCFDYSAFHPFTGEKYKLKFKPLIAMDVTILSESYMGLRQEEAASNRLLSLKDACRKVSGNFTLLWHNNHLAEERIRQIYKSVIEN